MHGQESVGCPAVGRRLQVLGDPRCLAGEHQPAQTEVPPAVARTFARGGRNFQRTHDDGAERMTAEIWRREGG